MSKINAITTSSIYRPREDRSLQVVQEARQTHGKRSLLLRHLRVATAKGLEVLVAEAVGTPTYSLDLVHTLFDNYKDQGVGWGTNGFGYKNFKTLRGGDAKMAKKQASLPMRLSGFLNHL
jgi:hypothetical protein